MRLFGGGLLGADGCGGPLDLGADLLGVVAVHLAAQGRRADMGQTAGSRQRQDGHKQLEDEGQWVGKRLYIKLYSRQRT